MSAPISMQGLVEAGAQRVDADIVSVMSEPGRISAATEREGGRDGIARARAIGAAGDLGLAGDGDGERRRPRSARSSTRRRRNGAACARYGRASVPARSRW